MSLGEDLGQDMAVHPEEGKRQRLVGLARRGGGGGGFLAVDGDVHPWLVADDVVPEPWLDAEIGVGAAVAFFAGDFGEGFGCCCYRQ